MKMYRLPFVITVFAILFFVQLISAQKNTGTIKGRIITADSNAANVAVTLKMNGKSTITDSKGNFVFHHLPALSDTLEISSIEVIRLSIPVRIENNQVLDLNNIILTFNIEQLPDIEVKGRTGQSYKSDYSFLGTKTQTALTDIPQSISTITKEMIQDKMEFNLKEAADQVIGVNHYSGYDEYAIRGFRADNAKLINGLRGYNTTFTSPMLVNIERIEVIKGPSAALYGNCDPGGTMNLVTKKPLATTESGLTITGGSWNHFRVQEDITGPINNNKTLLYRLNAGYDNSNSFRNQVYAKSYEIAPSFSFIPNKRFQLNVDVSFSHTNTVLDRGQPGLQNDLSPTSTPANLSITQPGDYLHENVLAANVLFSYKINKHINFNSGYLYYQTQQNNAEHGLHSYITNDSVNLYFTKWAYYTHTHSITNYFTFHFNTGKFSHQLLAGYDFVRSSVSINQQYFEDSVQFGVDNGIVGTFSLKNPKYFSRSVNNNQVSDYDSDATNVDGTIYYTHGIYTQEQVSLNRFKFLVGLREVVYVRNGPADTAAASHQNVFLPRIGIVYAISPETSLYGTYNKGFDPFEASNATQIFNAPFKPVTSELFEIGAKANFLHNKLYTSISLYQLTLQNVAVNANDISNSNLFIQQGMNRSSGIETEINGNILPNLSISAAYTYCIAKVIKSQIPSQEGAIMENAPKNSSNSWIKYTFKKGFLKNFGLTSGHSQYGIRNTLQEGFILPSFIVLNAGFLYSYQHLNIALNLYNITNKTYWMGAYNNIYKWPGMQRNLLVSLAYKF